LRFPFQGPAAGRRLPALLRVGRGQRTLAERFPLLKGRTSHPAIHLSTTSRARLLRRPHRIAKVRRSISPGSWAAELSA